MFLHPITIIALLSLPKAIKETIKAIFNTPKPKDYEKSEKLQALLKQTIKRKHVEVMQIKKIQKKEEILIPKITLP